MTAKAFALVAAIAAASTAFAAEGTFTRTLSVSGAPSIPVSTGSGNIHVIAGPQSEVRINAKQHIVGTIGGGGPTLHIDTGSGDIFVG